MRVSSLYVSMFHWYLRIIYFDIQSFSLSPNMSVITLLLFLWSDFSNKFVHVLFIHDMYVNVVCITSGFHFIEVILVKSPLNSVPMYKILNFDH